MSAKISTAAANTTQANGPPMISATTPSTTTTTLATVITASHTWAATDFTFCMNEVGAIPASLARRIAPAATRPRSSRRPWASMAIRRAASNRD